MPAFLPSAQFTRIIGALVIVGVGIFGAYYLATSGNASSASLNDSSDAVPVIISDNPLLKQVADLDSDKDGLRDWEERLWKTSTMSKDSDGDGTSDGDEVATNRNPLVKGPNDSIRDTIDLTESLTPESLEGLTATERVAREFFVEYMSYKQGGKALSKEEQEALLQFTLKNSVEEEVIGKTYTEKDIVPSATNDTLAYELYGNSIGSSILRNSFKTENELALLERALRTQNVDDLVTIGKISDGYRAMISDFLQIPVPKDLVNSHLTLLSDMDTIAIALHNMTLVTSDPVQSLLSVANYDAYVRNLLNTVENIQAVLQLNGAVFGPEETGTILMSTGVQTNTP